ncbi:hypothetical protein [Cardinium endosymbiont of Sogatella furcifera]|uniref:hypothetical protein n=1 Tax=Cardinium endosymbiont of Sogatella furcifera TaxID=650378 RepID=UPI0013B3CA8F|nr:hypothetical protein [Cardinium endosymbiont of Sogatella furcifera]
MKCFLLFLLWLAPLVALGATNGSFWSRIQLQSVFSIQADSYKVHIKGMHPGRQAGEMEVNGATTQAYLIRWHHAPSIHFEKDNDGISGSDTKGIFGFTGTGMTLAAQFLVTMDFRQLRIGSGMGIRCSFFKEMAGQWVDSIPSNGAQNEGNNALYYIPERAYYFTWTPLVRLGFKLIENQNYTLLIDGTWAPCIYNHSELGKAYYWIYERNFDLGGTWEKQITRYLYGQLRVAYGFCCNNELVEAYETSNPKRLIPNHLISVSHAIGSILAQVGISMRLPGLSKCPIRGCATTLDHAHYGNYYRGG